MPLRDDLLNPIPGENPSGENLRYAPVYDQIKEARREDDDVAQGEWQHERKKADWPLVVKLAGEALATKSKDLQIAAWLTEAMLRREGFSGLDASLGLIHGLLESFWDTLYPEIEDGDLEMRAVPLEWIGSRLDDSIRLAPLTRSGLDFRAYRDSRSVPYETDTAKAEQRSEAISEGKLTPEEFDQAVDETPREFYEKRKAEIDACLERVAALESFCDERFGDVSPNFNGLKKSLEEAKQTVHVLLAKKRQQEPEDSGYAAGAGMQQESESLPESSDSYAAAAVAPARAPKPRARGPLAPEPVDRDDAIARVVGAARWLRQNEPYGPAGYMLVRSLRWGELLAGAPDPDATLFEAPATEVRQEIRRLFTEGSYQEALDAAEAAIGEPCGRAWLDVHRYAVQCCDSLGYYAVAAAIRAGLRALLAEIPTLADRSLTDDTPTANSETRQWIQEQVAPAAPAAAETSWYQSEPDRQEQENEGEAEGPPDAHDLAMQAMRNGDARGAIEILSREAALTGSGRARFQRKIQLAQMCLGTGNAAIAIPILEGILAEIDRRDLEAWEAPETIAHALTLLYRAMQSVEASPEEKQKLYSRICRLDPVQALSLPR